MKTTPQTETKARTIDELQRERDELRAQEVAIETQIEKRERRKLRIQAAIRRLDEQIGQGAT